MKKIINFVICSVLAIVAVMGLTTGSVNAQQLPDRSGIAYNTANTEMVAIDNKDEAPGSCDVVCNPGDKYLPNPSDCGSFYQCSYGTPIFQPCPEGLVFNPNLNVCEWPYSYECKETCP